MKLFIDYFDTIRSKYCFDTTNYHYGIYTTLYHSYKTLDFDELTFRLLDEFVDAKLKNMPPIIVLLYLDSLLLYGHRYDIVIERSFACFNFYNEKVSLYDLPTDIDNNRSGWKFINNIENVEKFLSSLNEHEMLLYGNILIGQMLLNGSYLLKLGKRTLQDYNDVIAPRCQSHIKKFKQRYEETNNLQKFVLEL